MTPQRTLGDIWAERAAQAAGSNGHDLSWCDLAPGLRERFIARLAKTLPDANPVQHWERMGTKHRREWLWNEMHADAKDDESSWDVEVQRINANADPATVTAIQDLARRFVDGARLLEDVEAFLRRFIAYPSEQAVTAHVLWIAHTHCMDIWESTPRLAFLSPEPGSGKSRALEVTELLVPNPVHAVSATSAYLFRKVGDEESGLPTILFDEIDTIFGPRAKDNEDIRGMLNAGHRKGAVAGRCVVRGKVIETEELPAYSAVALAGLDDLPDTLMSRSIVIRIRRRGPDEYVQPFRHRVYAEEGNALRDRLAEWAKSIPIGRWPEMPAGIEDREADKWEPLLAVADAAGGKWPERARCDAVTLVTLARVTPPSLGVRLLTDLKAVFDANKADHLFTETIVDALVSMELAPWGDLRGKPLDARGLASRLGRYELRSQTVRIGEHTAKGYRREDLADAWGRYVSDQSA